MSVHTAILDELELRLEEIDGTGSYTEVVKEVHWKKFELPTDHNHFPVVYILIDTDRFAGGQIGNQDRTGAWTLLLWGYTKDTKHPNERALLFMADMKKAICTHRSAGVKDLSLNNLCGSFRIISTDIVGNLKQELRTVEIVLEVTMHESSDV